MPSAPGAAEISSVVAADSFSHSRNIFHSLLITFSFETNYILNDFSVLSIFSITSSIALKTF
jgi:hypothetical protein